MHGLTRAVASMRGACMRGSFGIFRFEFTRVHERDFWHFRV
jgi:hypothetical protein